MDRLRSRALLGLLVAFVALGIGLRLDGVGEMPLFGDEYHTLTLADADARTILSTFDLYGSHVVLPLLQKFALDLFGGSVLSLRLPALIPGLLLLLLASPVLSRFVGRVPAGLATVALALSPMQIYYARFARGYALTLLLGLLFAWLLVGVLTSGERRRSRLAGLFLLAIALLFTHLSTAGFLLGMGLAGLGLAWRREHARGVLVLASVLGGAALVAFLLYVPLLEDVHGYFSQRVDKDQPLTWLGIPALLFGGRLSAGLVLLLLPLGWFRGLRERRVETLLGLAACLGPAVVLFTTRPHGMEYAYARYLLLSQPFLYAFAALGLLELLRLVGRGEERPGSAVAVGTAALVLAFTAGPQGPFVPSVAPLDNSYLELYPLAPFDVPYASAPPIYAEIAADAGARVVVESPPIPTRGALLYRSYRRTHGKRVWIGLTGGLPRGMMSRPYVDFMDLPTSAADYVILHRDPAREVRDYFRFVYEEQGPLAPGLGEAGFLERHQAVFLSSLPGEQDMNAAAAYVRELLGPAYYKDERVLVWKLASR